MDAKEKANLFCIPTPCTSLVPSLPPSTMHLSLFTPHLYTYTIHLPPSDLLSLHLCSCLSPVGCSVALVRIFFCDVSLHLFAGPELFRHFPNGSSLCNCMNAVREGKLHLAANCCHWERRMRYGDATTGPWVAYHLSNVF